MIEIKIPDKGGLFMKKFIAVLTLLVALAATSLAACNKGGGGNNSESSPDTESSSVHIHSMQYFPEQAATCVMDGRHAYYSCGSCGKTFSDENGEVPITSGDITIPATGHKYEGGYCENCDGIDPEYKGFAIGKEITGVAVDENGVLSWSKIRSASKYEIVYAVGKENKTLAVDKRAASADITEISDFPLNYGKNYLTVKAYEKAQSGEETEISSLNLIVKNLNSGYEAANADYEDKFVTASGFTADEKGAIHKDVVVDGRTMPTIKKDISVSDGYTLAFYYTASDRENDLNRINRFTRELSNGANRYYAAVLSGENLVKTYDIVLHGVKEVGMEFAKESVTTESDGTKVSSLMYYFTQMQKTALQGDYIDINGLYEKIPEGYVIRDDNWNIYEKDGDYIMPYDSADVNCYYAAEEKTVRAEADEFKYYAQTFYIRKVNDRSSSHYDYMNNKYVFKFELTPKIYDDKGTEIVYNELYVPGDVIGNKTQISSFGFATVKRLIIGRGITTLPQQAFYNVKNLEYVALPNTLTSAGNWLFPKAQKGTLKIYLEKNNENGFSDKWNYVEGSFDVFTTYYGYKNVTRTVEVNGYKIEAGDAEATVAGASANAKTDGVPEKINLGYQSFAVTAFADGSLADLTGFTIPAFISEMNFKAFSNTLKYIDAAENHENYSSYCSLLYNKDLTEILFVPYAYDMKVVNLSDNLTVIKSGTFAEKKIETVNIGKKTVEIESEAFKKSNVRKVSGEFVQIVGDRAFKDCSVLTTVDFPKLKTVGESAFEVERSTSSYIGNSSLTEIAFAADAESIGKNAFKDCIKLTKVDFGGVKTIGEYAFSSCPLLRTLNLESVTDIGANAFENCSHIYSVTVGKNLSLIADDAFKGCIRLIEIYNLSSVDFTAGDTNNGGIAKEAVDIYTDKSVPSKVVKKDEFYFYDCENQFLFDYGNITSPVIFPEGVGGKKYDIRKYAFINKFSSSDNYKTWKIVIGDFVNKIGDRAFYNSPNLESIDFGNSVTEIGSGAFWGVRSTGSTSITIPDSVIKMGTDLFGARNIKDLTIPFLGTTENDPITLVDFLGSKSDMTQSLIKLTISRGKIGDRAFDANVGLSGSGYCAKLTTVTLKDGVTSIGSMAFKNAKTLYLRLPNTLEYIGEDAFSSAFYSGEDLFHFSGTKHEPGSGSKITYLGNESNKYLVACYFSPLNPTELLAFHPDAEFIILNKTTYSGITKIELSENVKQIGSTTLNNFYKCTTIFVGNPQSVFRGGFTFPANITDVYLKTSANYEFASGYQKQETSSEAGYDFWKKV